MPGAALLFSAIWLDVPHVVQPERGCGAASVAMVMQYWARRVPIASPPLAEIHRALYSESTKGTPASRVLALFEKHGFHAFAFEGRQQDLEEQLRQGRPVIVARKPRGSDPHFSVLTGIVSDRVYVNDPALGKDIPVDGGRFEREWAAAGRWMLIAVPRQEQ